MKKEKVVKEKREKVVKVKAKRKPQIYKYKPPNIQFNECGYLTIKTNKDLDDHKQHQHLGMLAYNCLECGKAFGKEISLQSHVVVVHTIDPSVCDICGKICKYKHQLRCHKNGTHFKVKYKVACFVLT